MTRRRTTYCRLCEVGCGLVADVAEDGTIERIRPDHDHPVTKGFACNKGLLTREIHHDPARLDRPQRRSRGPGEAASWEPVSWDEALDDIAARLADVVERHGPSSVALYLGNPAAFNAGCGPAAGLFLVQLGSDRIFTAGSQDCVNKFAIGELLFGSANLHLIPDLARTDHVLLLGTNPRVSKGSFLSVPDPIGQLAAVEARGGTVRFVDPRRGEPTVGETFRVRPDTDVYLLAAMLHEIDRAVGFDPAGAGRVGSLDELREFLARFPAERVAPVVGLDAETIRRLALEFAAAPTASAHLSTGVNMGRQGALAYWLLQLLVLLTGNFDRPGGNVPATRGTSPIPRMTPADATGFVDTPWGPYRPTIGGLPGALLGDMIRAGDPPIRALVVVAGNPLLSIGGGDGLASALGDLDLLVTLDYYRNATGELADYVLPVTDWFEREDLNSFVQGTQPVPYVQWTGPVVEPQGDRRAEHEILADLATRMGTTPAFPADADLLAMLHDPALGEHGLSVDALRARPDGIALLPDTEPGGFLDRHAPDGRIDGNPEMLAPARERAAAIFDELADEPTDQLKLITRRTAHTLNSALHNLERLARSGAADNPLWIAPADAERLDIADGARVRVANRYGSVDAAARIDDSLRPGVVAMTHGFGHGGASGMPVAQQHPGVNVNTLSPTGPGSFDPVSSMSHLTGIPVTVTPA